MIINADTQRIVEQKYLDYVELLPDERWILNVLSVVYKPITLGNINKLLKAIHSSSIEGWPNDLITLKNQKKDKLIQKGFISESSKGIRVTYYLAKKLTKHALNEHVFLPILKIAEDIVPVLKMYEWEKTLDDELRLARDFYFLNDFNKVQSILSYHKNPQVINYKKNQMLIECCFIDFDLSEFLSLPPDTQYQAFASWLHIRRQHGASDHFALMLLESVHENINDNNELSILLAEQYLYHGKFQRTHEIITALPDTCYSLQIKAVLALLNNQFKQADDLFIKAIILKNKYGKKKKQYLDGILGMFYKLNLLILAGVSEPTYYTQVTEQIDNENADKNNNEDNNYLSQFIMGVNTSLSCAGNYYSHAHTFAFLEKFHVFYFHLINWLDALFEFWANNTLSSNSKITLNKSIHYFEETEYLFFSKLARQLLSQDNADPNLMLFLPNAVKAKKHWDLALEKLIALNPNMANRSTPENQKPTRLIWEITHTPYELKITAREQKISQNGWTKGRAISLKKLYEEHNNLDFLSEQDKKACKAIEPSNSWYSSQNNYCINPSKMLSMLNEAPNVYITGDYVAPIELKQKEPELTITKHADYYILSIHDVPSEQDIPPFYSLKEISAQRYEFTIFEEQHLKVTEIIGEEGLAIPIEAKEKVLLSIKAIAPLLNIHSDIDELDTGLETVKADKHLYINVQPIADGLQFTCLSMPFTELGPAFKPSIGSAKITSDINGKRVATKRDLLYEQELLDILDGLCPSFNAMHDNILSLEDAQSAFQALEELEKAITHNDDVPIKLRWPKGKKIKLSKPLESHHIQLSITKKNQWFDLNGSINVDDNKVIELKSLLELVRHSDGRFISLDNDQILALSNDMRQRLLQLDDTLEEGQFHPLASFAVNEAITPMRMKTLHAWESQTKKMHQANELFVELPRSLKAQLRDYQLQGYDWALRLAHWGAGACLADDMGLGKTLQALAVLLKRAEDGPSLVIAPTSVCFNWHQEAMKFAPSLNIHALSEHITLAAKVSVLSDLKAYDCVVISYGLLQRHSELLQKTCWHTIIADEAQALKNPLAKRTKAAYALKGNFKMITTGTPIENNLTELWSLFKFINPGLLGNLKRFSQKFISPIDNAKDDKTSAYKAQKGLKDLIKPFILRRMKSQVLSELPPRTDINITIELSEEERTFYEALRQTAIEKLTQNQSQANSAEQRIRMFAELTKLRQACCNPELIVTGTNITSSKMDTLHKLLTELRSNNHKTLIFSQFVGNLKLIKAYLDNLKIDYQYLDGSTPQKDRQQRVNDFQRGISDVFLISLKAGGSGLNLTAADYVIHMDPWWNPAVEEQASDRAHRLGQTRPVTVYRLITKDTIEEQIVSLHQHKRDLADKLLAGNEQASKLSVEDLLSMLKKTF